MASYSAYGGWNDTSPCAGRRRAAGGIEPHRLQREAVRVDRSHSLPGRTADSSAPTPSSSSSVKPPGASANWRGVHPPCTMIQSPGDRLAALAASRRSASRRESTPSNRTCWCQVSTPRVKWKWLSMRPGMTVAPRHVDDLRVAAGKAADLRRGARGDDAAVADRERLDGTKARVHGEDLAVRDDGVDAACCASAVRSRASAASRAREAGDVAVRFTWSLIRSSAAPRSRAWLAAWQDGRCCAPRGRALCSRPPPYQQFE